MNVEAMIRQHIAKNILFSDNGFSCSNDASFLNEGIIDSMNVMELIMFVEEKFGVEVTDGDIVPDNFDSVAKIVAYIGRKTSQPV